MGWSLLANNGQAAWEYLQRSGSLKHNLPLVGAFVAIALFWLLLYWWDQRQVARRPARKEASLLEELFAAHRLSHAERHTLLSVAARCQLEEPAVLFVDRRLWQSLLNEKSHRPSAVERLYVKLFGVPDDVPAVNEPAAENGSRFDDSPSLDATLEELEAAVAELLDDTSPNDASHNPPPSQQADGSPTDTGATVADAKPSPSG